MSSIPALCTELEEARSTIERLRELVAEWKEGAVAIDGEVKDASAYLCAEELLDALARTGDKEAR